LHVFNRLWTLLLLRLAPLGRPLQEVFNLAGDSVVLWPLRSFHRAFGRTIALLLRAAPLRLGLFLGCATEDLADHPNHQQHDRNDRLKEVDDAGGQEWSHMGYRNSFEARAAGFKLFQIGA
jgi:hypothetical protein